MLWDLPLWKIWRHDQTIPELIGGSPAFRTRWFQRLPPNNTSTHVYFGNRRAASASTTIYFLGTHLAYSMTILYSLLTWKGCSGVQGCISTQYKPVTFLVYIFFFQNFCSRKLSVKFRWHPLHESSDFQELFLQLQMRAGIISLTDSYPLGIHNSEYLTHRIHYSRKPPNLNRKE